MWGCVRRGQVAEWLMAADCKSAAPCELRRFESSPVHHQSAVFGRAPASANVTFSARVQVTRLSANNQYVRVGVEALFRNANSHMVSQYEARLRSESVVQRCYQISDDYRRRTEPPAMAYISPL